MTRWMTNLERLVGKEIYDVKGNTRSIHNVARDEERMKRVK